MARSVGWRRTPSDATSWHQDQAGNTTIYILRETGPTGFLLKEEGEAKHFKVFLGDPHSCTCPVFRKEKELCKHICWVLLKKFRVPRENPVSWQLGLVEREINEILRGILVRQEPKPTAAARRYATLAAKATEENGKPALPQRDITDDDVCPICQEILLEKHLPVTYCKFGCGNNVHIKCMKIWAEHQQKTARDTSIKCPMCREDFGPISLLQQEYRNSSFRDNMAERSNEHLGVTCKKCQACPIVGKCYKCVVCSDFYFCQACFNTPTHTEHIFEFKQRRNQRWRPAPDRRSCGVLPQAMITNLMQRELSDGDYDLLAQLDNQAAQQLSDLTEETVRSFPLERIRHNSIMLSPGGQCRICLRAYQEGQFVRRLPCRHKFHKQCIDNWLLHQHPTCPLDGTVFTNDTVRQMREGERLRQQQRSNGQSQNTTDTGRSSELLLEIPGVGIARCGSLPTTNALRGGNIRSTNTRNTAGQLQNQSFSQPSLGNVNDVSVNGRKCEMRNNFLRGMEQAGPNNNRRERNGGLTTISSMQISQIPPSIPPLHCQPDLVVGMDLNQGSLVETFPGFRLKPPSGRSMHSDGGVGRRGRQKKREVVVDRGRQRSNSSGGAQSTSAEREEIGSISEILGPLYIGHDPATVNGFISDYKVSSTTHNAQRTNNKHQHRKRNTDSKFRWGNTHEINDRDMILSGNALTGLTVKDLFS